MKEIKQEVKRTETITKYKANDGTIFDDRDECMKYENSAKCVLISKYKKLVKKSISEYDFMSIGYEDNDFDLVILNSKEDVDTLKQLYCLMNWYDIKQDDNNGWRDKAFATIDKSFNNNDPLLVGKRLYDECFWINGTKSEMIKKIEDFCKFEETKPEPEYGGC